LFLSFNGRKQCSTRVGDLPPIPIAQNQCLAEDVEPWRASGEQPGPVSPFCSAANQNSNGSSQVDKRNIAARMTGQNLQYCNLKTHEKPQDAAAGPILDVAPSPKGVCLAKPISRQNSHSGRRRCAAIPPINRQIFDYAVPGVMDPLTIRREA